MKKYSFSDLITIFGISSIIFGVPLAYTGQKYYFYWWSIPKLFVFTIGFGFLLLGWSINLFKQKFIYLPKTLVKPLLVFLIIQIIASINGKNALFSFVGFETPSRSFLIQLFVFAFFLILYDFFIKKPDVKNLLVSVLIFGSMLVSAISIYQGAILGWNRVASTLGNPVFLAAYLSICTWFAIARFIESQNDKESQALYIVALLWLVTGFVLAYTRSSWLAFIISGLMFYLITSHTSRKFIKTLNIIFASIVLFALIAISFQMVRESRLEKTSQFIGRARETISGSVGARREVWSSTIHQVADNPSLGNGVDSFQYVSTKYLSKDLLKSEFTGYGTSMYYFDPHNFLLNQMNSSGILGLASLLWIIISIAFVFLRNMKNMGKEQIILIAAFVSFNGYFINLLFQPDFFQTSAISLFCLALALSHTEPVKINDRRILSIPKLIIVIFAFLIGFNFLQIIADIYYQDSFTHDNLIDEKNSSIALKLAPYRYFYLGHMSEVYLKAFLQYGKKSDLENSIKFSSLGISNNKDNPLFYVFLSRGLYEFSDNKNLNESINAAKTAEKLYPNHPEPKYLIGRSILKQKKYKESLYFLKSAAGINERANDVLILIGNTYEKIGNEKAAQFYYDRYDEIISSN